MSDNLIETLRATTEAKNKQIQDDRARECRAAQSAQRERVAAYLAEHLDNNIEYLSKRAREAAADGERSAAVKRVTYDRNEEGGILATMHGVREHFEELGFEAEMTWKHDHHWDSSIHKWEIGVEISW